MIVLAVVVALILLSFGGNNPISNIIHPSSKPVPPFDFTVAKAQAIATDPAAKMSKLKGAAKSTSAAVATVLNGFYTRAFLDPANWQDGAYDDAWSAFDQGSAAMAQKSAATLTAGATAGDTYSDIQPGRSVLRTQVLFDAKGQPSTVSATVTFKAIATKTAGGQTIMVSNATFFLRDIGGEWKVVSFEAKRADTERAPKPTTASASAAPSGAAS